MQTLVAERAKATATEAGGGRVRAEGRELVIGRVSSVDVCNVLIVSDFFVNRAPLGWLFEGEVLFPGVFAGWCAVFSAA